MVHGLVMARNEKNDLRKGNRQAELLSFLLCSTHALQPRAQGLGETQSEVTHAMLGCTYHVQICPLSFAEWKKKKINRNLRRPIVCMCVSFFLFFYIFFCPPLLPITQPRH